MNGDKYLLDTNIVLYVLNGDTDMISFLNGQYIHISVITEMELLSFPTISKQESQDIGKFIADIEVKDLVEKVKNTAINIRKKYKLKLPDSIIAATAMVYDMPLTSGQTIQIDS